MKTDPRYPYTSQCQNGGCNTRGDLRPPIVDTKDPILKPWAAKHMQETNEEVLSGKMAIPFTSQSRCWPGTLKVRSETRNQRDEIAQVLLSRLIVPRRVTRP